MQPRWKLSLANLAVAVATGTFAGAGGFTFHYAEGWSYFDPAEGWPYMSKASETCANCHVMQPHYHAWLKSSHHAAASCADCHLPAGFAHAMVSKVDNGFFHAWAFTFQDYDQLIRIKPRNRRIVENNCIRCHQSLVAQMQAYAELAGHSCGVSCLNCHNDVGHLSRPRL